MAHGWWIGFVAVIAGWIVTESGRQPWIVTGILRTADAHLAGAGRERRDARSCCSSSSTAIVFAMGIYYINRLIEHGPQGRAVEPPDAGMPNRPLSAAAARSAMRRAAAADRLGRR